MLIDAIIDLIMSSRNYTDILHGINMHTILIS